MNRKILWLGFLWLFSNALWASPNQMLQKTADQLIAQLQQNKKAIKSDAQLVKQIVTRVVLPHVDQERMARSVVSRTAWQDASASTQREFIVAFRTLVMNTYAAAFQEYTNETVAFKPLQTTGTEVEVQSNLIRPGKPSVHINYHVEKVGNDWKIYDFTVEGVSMIQSFRAQLMTPSQQGLPAVIQELQQHNKA